MPKLSDDDLLPIGEKYRGKRLKDIPDSYFIWLWGENKHKDPNDIDPLTQSVLDYIEDSFDERKLD